MVLENGRHRLPIAVQQILSGSPEVWTVMWTFLYYQAVREDAITPNSVSRTYTENSCTWKLTSVWIGPKSGLSILASDDHLGRSKRLETDNVGYLVKFPGVGKCTAFLRRSSWTWKANSGNCCRIPIGWKSIPSMKPLADSLLSWRKPWKHWPVGLFGPRSEENTAAVGKGKSIQHAKKCSCGSFNSF